MPFELCPDESQLHAFATGNLPREVGDQIADHVASCQQCESSVDLYDVDSRALANECCSGSWQDEYLGEPDLLEALRRVQQLGRVEQPGRVEPLAGDVLVEAKQASCRPPESLPRDLGDYELLEMVGEGGMGAVYRARHRRLNKPIALKVLVERRLADPSAIKRFSREMEAIGKIDHANIVCATDAGEVDGMHYLAMQWVDGLDLGRMAEAVGQLRVNDACEIVRQAAEGLESARQRGVVHRDIKPSNLMLDRSGCVKVLDLGLALFDSRHDEQLGDLTIDGQVLGTLEYMAPEQLDDSHGVDSRADVYSLGATLYRLLAGRAPLGRLAGGTPLERLRAMACAELTPIEEVCPDLPEDLAKSLSSMLSRNLEERPSTPREVAESLAPFTAGHDLPRLIENAMSRLPPSSVALTSTVDRIATPTLTSNAINLAPSRQVSPVWKVATFALGFVVTAFAVWAAVPIAMDRIWPPPAAGVKANTKPVLRFATFEHEMAHWVISQGGQVTFTPKGDPTTVQTIDEINRIPAHEFAIVDISLQGDLFRRGEMEKIGRLKGLIALRLNHTNLTDEDLVWINNMPLMRLELVDTKITDRGIKKLGYLPDLQSLLLGGTLVGNDTLESISRFKRLRELDLSRTLVNDKGLVHLQALQDLENLSLDENDISDEGAEELAKLTTLRKLGIWKTKISAQWNERLEQSLPLLGQ